jgi:cytosine/adenosine deaminase-related metal-dependent hydrolase
MSYQKFQAAAIFDGTEMLGPDQVLVTDDHGLVEAILPADLAGDDVQKLEGILSPGFINCHCHLELSHMRGLIPQKTGLVDFVFKVVTERHHSDETIQEAIARAGEEMRANGIVAVGDICNNLTTLEWKKTADLQFYNFIELSGWLPDIAPIRFEKSKEYYDAFMNAGISTAMVPHAPYSVSQPLWKLMQPFFKGKTISMHNQETAFEDELFQSGTGDFMRMYEMMKLDTSFFNAPAQSSLQHSLPKLAESRELILVHNTFTTAADIDHAQQRASNIHWCLCIKANQYIENAVPPVNALRNAGCNIVVGTDSLASNDSLDILDELKTIQRFFPEVTLTEMLRWATANGATALQLQDSSGSFEPGKKPGIVLIDGVVDGRLSPSSTSTRIL